MHRITKVYTRTGDKGDTGLGGGQRVPKDSLRIEAFGTVDELNSIIGLARAHCKDERLSDWLKLIQNELFTLGSDLCILEEDKKKYPIPGIEAHHVEALESMMDTCQEDLKPLVEFILPGGTIFSCFLHQARTVCRRAERILVALRREEVTSEYVLTYLNRLSDFLFVLSRYANLIEDIPEHYWQKP
tara:strand:- start:2151 stop:2711 length:561 start_codon:yes stop_codon:yes gene_type:complete